jgi:hypothetical protein
MNFRETRFHAVGSIRYSGGKMAILSPAKVALFREILGKLERSKSPLLVTISIHKFYELALNPGGQG